MSEVRSMSMGQSVLDTYRNPVFIETGTGDGFGMVLAKACGFKQMITIDTHKESIAKAREMTPEADCIVGDAGCLLGEVIDLITKDLPITFWLDAHTHYPGQPIETTVICELATILRKPWRPGSVIMIDDWSAFGTRQWAWTHVCTLGDLSAAVTPYLARGFSVNWEKNVEGKYEIMVIKEGRI